MENRVIRKIWIGKSTKEDSMSWHVGQVVRLGKDPSEKGVINHIIIQDEKYEVFVKKGSVIVPWKSGNMDHTVEYDLTF